MDLTVYIDAYSKRTYIVSEKQKAYITSLCRTNAVFPCMSNILKRAITEWTDLHKEDVSTVIKTLMSQIPLSIRQKGQVMEQYANIEAISQRLHREVKSLDDLSVSDFRFLMKSPDRFYLIPRDRPIQCRDDYEYGYQISDYCEDRKMYYVKFFDLMMLDYDKIDLVELEARLSIRNDFCYRIYETHNGFHVFVTSQRFPHKLESTLMLMKELGCDPYYCLFSYKYGYKIRLSPKKGRDELFLARYVKTIGENEDMGCRRLLRIHDFFIEQKVHPIE